MLYIYLWLLLKNYKKRHPIPSFLQDHHFFQQYLEATTFCQTCTTTFTQSTWQTLMANDSIYLVNYSNGGSAMCLYNNKAWSVGGEKPDQVILTASSPRLHYRGRPTDHRQPLAPIHHQYCSRFEPAGTQVGTARQIRASLLPPNLANVPNASGWAVYNIFRDNNRVLYTDSVLGDAISLYVCGDVSFPSLLTPTKPILHDGKGH